MKPRLRLILTVLGGATLGLTLGDWAGLVVGGAAGAGAGFWLGRMPNASPDDRRAEAELPFACDLLAAAVRAGAPPEVAARCVGRALGGPLGARLGRVERALRLGTPIEEAWSYVGQLDGTARLTRAAARSAHSGSAFAGALFRIADDLRSDRLVEADASARRAGVLIVLPLGLCFLPAFVLAGLVPVIVAVLGGVLSP